MSNSSKNKIAKFSIIILNLTCFIFVLIGILSSINDYRNREDFFYDIGNYYTEIVERILDEQIADVVDKTILISQSNAIERYLDQPASAVKQNDVKDFLMNIIEHFDEYHKIVLDFNGDKDKNISVGDFDIDIDVKDDYFLMEDYFISNVYQDDDMLIQYYYIVIPIYIDDALAGTFTAVVDISEFTDLFVSDISYSETGYTFFLKENGELIAHPLQGKTDELKTEIKIAATDIIDKYNAGINLIKSSFNNKDKYYYVREYDFSSESSSKKMLIVFCQESTEIYRGLKDPIMYMTILIIVMLSLILIKMLFIR